MIDLAELNIGSLATLRAITSNQGGDAVIRTLFDGEASSLRIDGVSESELLASHFVFAGRENRSTSPLMTVALRPPTQMSVPSSSM